MIRYIIMKCYQEIQILQGCRIGQLIRMFLQDFTKLSLTLVVADTFFDAQCIEISVARVSLIFNYSSLPCPL